ncbi:MAG: Multidrug resistance protein MdtC [Phycisphaerae bacterium]|nr:Multidrug resistance protein MdtC [Phycisphaerae bacterium]
MDVTHHAAACTTRAARTATLALMLLAVAVLAGSCRRDAGPSTSRPVSAGAVPPAADDGRPTLVIDAPMPGYTPERVADCVAVLLEPALRSLPELADMQSTSSFGWAQIVLRFKPGCDFDAAARAAGSAIDKASNRPPGLAEGITIRRLDPCELPMLYLVVSATDAAASPADMRDWCRWIIQPSINSAFGVADASIFGGGVRETRVQLDPARLTARGLSVDDVLAALKKARDAVAPTVTTTPSEVKVATVAEQPIDSIVVAMRDGQPIRLDDLATITQTCADNGGAAWVGSKAGSGRAMVLAVRRSFGSDPAEVTAALQAALEELRRALPPSVKLAPIDPHDRARAVICSIRWDAGVPRGLRGARLKNVVDILGTHPAAASVVAMMQDAEAPDSDGPPLALVTLAPEVHDAGRVIEDLRLRLAMPGGVVQMRMAGAGPAGMRMTGAAWHYRLTGPDAGALHHAACLLVARLGQIAGLTDIASDVVLGGAILDLAVDPEKAAKLGLNPAHVSDFVDAARGRRIEALPGGRLIRVEFSKSSPDVRDLLDLTIPTPGGWHAPLRSIVNVAGRPGGLTPIRRMNGQAAETVSWNLAPGASEARMRAAVEKAAADALPAGVTGAFVAADAAGTAGVN